MPALIMQFKILTYVRAEASGGKTCYHHRCLMVVVLTLEVSYCRRVFLQDRVHKTRIALTPGELTDNGAFTYLDSEQGKLSAHDSNGFVDD